MSIYYSRFNLNLHPRTPYFQAHLPPGYALDQVMLACKSYRRLPPNLRALSELSKRWGMAHWGWSGDPNGSDGWYDKDGYELDPNTGKRLSDAENDALWTGQPSLDSSAAVDVPIPHGGFPDPATWEPLPESAEPSDDDYPDVAQLKSDVASHGLKRTAEVYGMTQRDLLEAIS